MEISKIVTAEEFALTTLQNTDMEDIVIAMIEFAKLHVKEALKEASEKASFDDVGIVENSILYAYSLENIK